MQSVKEKWDVVLTAVDPRTGKVIRKRLSDGIGHLVKTMRRLGLCLPRTRKLVSTPVLTVSLHERWKPWGLILRDARTGSVVLGFGGLLLAVSVVLLEGKR